MRGVLAGKNSKESTGCADLCSVADLAGSELTDDGMTYESLLNVVYACYFLWFGA
jgi:hypothetical protein